MGYDSIEGLQKERSFYMEVAQTSMDKEVVREARRMVKAIDREIKVLTALTEGSEK